MKPHDKVYARIQQSKTHGIGVFAIKRIKKGIYVFPNDDIPIVWLEKTALKGLPAGVKQLYNDFCIIKKNGELYGCPQNFNQMTISWYLNHSERPNIGVDKKFDLYALRNITKGEELTVNYKTYNNFAAGDTGLF